jgi:hypothetical protein
MPGGRASGEPSLAKAAATGNSARGSRSSVTTASCVDVGLGEATRTRQTEPTVTSINKATSATPRREAKRRTIAE